MTNNVFILNGPNLNLLGLRETDIYGTDTLADLSSRCRASGEKHGLSVDFRQSNHEGELVEWIHEARHVAQGIVINAAAYTHTSVAIHDALRAYDGYKIELHISNPRLRESFRHVSYVASAVDSIVAGLGTDGYELVLETLAQILPETAVP
jgi:3-dehydroquinate dehydratase-2